MRRAVLWALLALPSWHAGATDSTLGRVEVQGESAVAREKKTLAQLFKAEALFEKHRALAPLATLKFKVYARTQADTAPSLDLGLMAPGGRQSLQLDAQDRFVIDPAWRQLDDATEVRSRLADGRVTWRPDIRTPGLPEGERRLGDLRLQCRVAFNSGVARGGLVFGFLPSLSDGCGHAAWSSSNFADQPVFAVTLVHGERRSRSAAVCSTACATATASASTGAIRCGSACFACRWAMLSGRMTRACCSSRWTTLPVHRKSRCWRVATPGPALHCRRGCHRPT